MRSEPASTLQISLHFPAFRTRNSHDHPALTRSLVRGYWTLAARTTIKALTVWISGDSRPRPHPYGGPVNSRRTATVLLAALSLLVPLTTASAGSTRGHRPVNLRRPAISGSPVVGHGLTVSKGSWSGRPTTSATSGSSARPRAGIASAVKGATKRTLALTRRDVGRRMRVIVDASNAFGSAAVSSRRRGKVGNTKSGSRPTDVDPPAASGTPEVGQHSRHDQRDLDRWSLPLPLPVVRLPTPTARAVAAQHATRQDLSAEQPRPRLPRPGAGAGGQLVRLGRRDVELRRPS